MSFIGQYNAKLDSKNRVFLPAVFRRALQPEQQEGKEAGLTLVVRRDFFENCIVIYPVEQWRAEVDKVRSKLNRFDSMQQMVYRKLVSEAQEITLDGSGRMLVPRGLLDRVGIGQEVLFVGMENTIELWSPAVAEQNGSEGEAFMSDSDFAAGIKEFMTE